MRQYLLTVCALLALATGATAQQPDSQPALDIGARVRVWRVTPAESRLTGRVQAVTGDALELASKRDEPTQVLSLSALERIDVSRGKNRVLWMSGGALLGAATGIAIGRSAEDEPGDYGVGASADAANALILMAVGGIAGYLIAPERWRTVWRSR
jgi:hypothetical protein